MMQEARPFFLLDWLDDLMINQDAFQIAELLKTPSKLPKQKNSLHAYQSDGQIAMTEASSSTSSTSDEASNNYMLRSISSPQVGRVNLNIGIGGTPRSSNCKKNPTLTSNESEAADSAHTHGILPTRLFQAETKSASTTIRTQAQGHHQPLQPFKKRSMALGNGWNAKGLTKAKQGKWEAALACWDNALEIRLQIASTRKDQLEVANTWNNRGIALGKLGQYHNAIDALEQALEIRSNLLEKGHPQVVSTLHNIANVHQQQGDLTTALQVFGNAKSLLLVQSTIGTNSADPMLLARICTAIGHIYYQAQQWIDSKDAYQDALNILLQSNSNSNAQQQQQQQQQREIYELERDIQELNAKISIAPFQHCHGHRSPPPQQSPQH